MTVPAEALCSCFCHYANLCSGPCCGSFHFILDSFKHSCTPRKRSSKPFTNSSSPCRAMTLLWLVLFYLGLV
ncbi:uncharacterized protein LACBIDRAFT_309684 [Laccaria bicolor S238N-H82]|uniref:Predicted protein n=1 Tax=Laccaria bicolor (strain S238N-H82 / ATCC MYA-4686) TaxID=486041 RepID=B0DSU2_LACBS|nr:uncharacterized protein LACBIDRAFT_309684 [Laccaria bicolor S238N-H82]EDR02299.1 predicted protein [Laccaria bicolor S238N-H82]|eukprot:XP_001886976.1 predicted protein [Laccaria bicolor S238N-H82]